MIGLDFFIAGKNQFYKSMIKKIGKTKKEKKKKESSLCDL